MFQSGSGFIDTLATRGITSSSSLNSVFTKKQKKRVEDLAEDVEEI